MRYPELLNLSSSLQKFIRSNSVPELQEREGPSSHLSVKWQLEAATCMNGDHAHEAGEHCRAE